MRKILFRGKDDESGNFVYGLVSLERDCRNPKMLCDIKPCIVWEESGLLHSSFVSPETVGQYTGLKDKNDTKIFEGDVVKRQWGDYPYQYQLYVVKFSFGKFGFEAINTKGTRYIPYHYECEVIGNIYDNKLEDFENGC